MLYPAILIAGVIAVGSAGLMARYGLEAGLTAVQLSMWRMTTAAALLGIWTLLRQAKTNPLTRPQMFRLIGSGVCIGIHFAMWFLSLEYLHVARSTLMVSTTPLWAGLLGFFIPALRPTKRFWTGLALALVGLFLVTTMDTPAGHLKHPDWHGDLAATIGALIFVPYLLLSQKAQTEVPTQQAVAWIYSAAAVTLWLMALVTGQGTVPSSLPAWGSVLGMAVIAQLGGHTVFNWALKHFSAGQVGSALLLEPVFAAVLAWVLLNERLEPLQELGGILLLIGVAVTLSKRKTDADPAPA